jgi:hypothetical protein
MAEQQVFSEHEAFFGKLYTKMNWSWPGANNTDVPSKKILEITTLTLNYFPDGGGTVGRADISGRDINGSAVWRLQVIYVEPKKTVHLPFPKALKLEEGGYVEMGFVVDGPGTIFISANGTLSDV